MAKTLTTCWICLICFLLLMGCKTSPPKKDLNEEMLREKAFKDYASGQETIKIFGNWCPPEVFASTIAMQLFLKKINDDYYGTVSFFHKANVAIMEVYPSQVSGGTIIKQIAIYYWDADMRCYIRRLLFRTSKFYPLDLRELGEGRFEIITTYPSGQVSSLGITFDTSKFMD